MVVYDKYKDLCWKIKIQDDFHFNIKYPIHTNKTGLVKPGLTKWKAASEDWETKFYIGCKYALTYAFTMLNFKSKKHQLATSTKKTIFNRV